MEFRCAFINCYNLFSPKANIRRSKHNAAAIDTKIANLAETLRDAVGGQSPGLIGLCEVGDESKGVQLGDSLSAGDYKSIWSGPPPRKDTGLVILYKPQLFDLVRQWVGGELKGSDQRVRCMAALLQTRVGSKGLFWFVVNHWQSDLSSSSAPNDRIETWIELSHFFRNEAKLETDSIIFIGDFNCEPGDAPLVNHHGKVLESTRERELVFQEYRDGSYLYNLMWRHLGEVDPYEYTLSEDYSPQRPIGTYCPTKNKVGWKMLDQILITKPLLTGSYLQIVESSLRITQPTDNSSDHCAVGATFRIL